MLRFTKSLLGVYPESEPMDPRYCTARPNQVRHPMEQDRMEPRGRMEQCLSLEA